MTNVLLNSGTTNREARLVELGVEEEKTTEGLLLEIPKFAKFPNGLKGMLDDQERANLSREKWKNLRDDLYVILKERKSQIR